MGFAPGAAAAVAYEDFRIGVEIVSADSGQVALESGLPGTPEVALETVRLHVAQDAALSAQTWTFDAGQARLSFDLSFSDPRGDDQLRALSVLDRTYVIELRDGATATSDALRDLRTVDTGWPGLFDTPERLQALYEIELRQLDARFGQGFLDTLTALAPLNVLIPPLGSDLTEIVTGRQGEDLESWLVTNLARTLDGQSGETLSEMAAGLSGTDYYSVTQDGDAETAPSHVRVDFRLEEKFLPAILMDLSRIAAFSVLGSGLSLRPMVSARMSAEIRHRVGEDGRLRFDLDFVEPETTRIFDFRMRADAATVTGTTQGDGAEERRALADLTVDNLLDRAFGTGLGDTVFRLDLGGIGQLDVEDAFFGMILGIDAQGEGGVYAGGAAPVLTPMHDDADGAVYQLRLPVAYDGMAYPVSFVKTGYNDVGLDGPRALLVNDAEWELRTLLEEADARFDGRWMSASSGSVSPFVSLLLRNVESAEGISGFMTAPIPLLNDLSFLDLLQDPDASVLFEDIPDAVAAHLGELMAMTERRTPIHADEASDLVTFVGDLAARLDDMVGVRLVNDDVATLETRDDASKGLYDPEAAGAVYDSSSVVDTVPAELAPDRRLLDELRYRITIDDLVTLDKSTDLFGLPGLFRLGNTGLNLVGDNIRIPGFAFGLELDLGLEIDFGLRRVAGQ
jgi:hypothetical protein